MKDKEGKMGCLIWIWDFVTSGFSIVNGTVKHMLRDKELNKAINDANESLDNLEKVANELKDLDYDF